MTNSVANRWPIPSRQHSSPMTSASREALQSPRAKIPDAVFGPRARALEREFESRRSAAGTRQTSGFRRLPSPDLAPHHTPQFGKNLLPHVHRAVALLKRWLLGTLHGSVGHHSRTSSPAGIPLRGCVRIQAPRLWRSRMAVADCCFIASESKGSETAQSRGARL